MDEGWAQATSWKACLIKGGYLFLPCDNGMQTRETRTIKRHFWGDEEAAREIIMQSAPVGGGGHCSLGGLHDPPVCSHVDVRPGRPSVRLCIRCSWL